MRTGACLLTPLCVLLRSVDGDILCLRDVKALEAAAATGLLSAAGLAKCKALHIGKAKHDAQTMKTNNDNQCARYGPTPTPSTLSTVYLLPVRTSDVAPCTKCC
jgi:hypothetical protein